MNDKVIHAIAGFIISLIFGFIITPLAGLGVSLLAGLAKEVWDYFGHGTTERADLLATVQGGFVGCLFMLVLMLMR